MRELVPVALECIAKAAEDLSEAEVARAKAQMKVWLLMALESSSRVRSRSRGRCLAFGRVLTRDEILQKVDNLTVAEDPRRGCCGLALGADRCRGRAGEQGSYARSCARVPRTDLRGGIGLALFRLGVPSEIEQSGPRRGRAICARLKRATMRPGRSSAKRAVPF